MNTLLKKAFIGISTLWYCKRLLQNAQYKLENKDMEIEYWKKRALKSEKMLNEINEKP